MTPTRYVHHPVLVELTEGKLQADLYPKKGITMTTPEYHKAIEQGYKCTRVYFTIEYVPKMGEFDSYNQHFMGAKVQASGMPKWVKTDADWTEFSGVWETRFGIKLDRAKMVKNPGLKTKAKLMNNSLWGKFAETRPSTKSA